MSSLEKPSFVYSKDQQALERSGFGNLLWRGEPLRVDRLKTIKPESVATVSFALNRRNLPFFDGNVFKEILQQLEPHVRSRYAHVGLDVDSSLFSEIVSKTKIPRKEEGIIIKISVTNYGLSPIELSKEAKPLHLYSVPNEAYLKGKELEQIVGSEKGKDVYIQGKKGEDWKITYETDSKGLEKATGILLRIDKEQRFCLPSSDRPIRVSEEGTFAEFREWFDSNAERIGPNFSIPDNMFWVGKGPHITLSPNIYLKLGHDAYREVDNNFMNCGFQISSPLLEGLRTDHRIHSEIVGPCEWVRVDVVRSGKDQK